MNWQLWLYAFLITQVIEVPIWLVAGCRLGASRMILLALGSSAITHPIVWFAFPWETWPYLPTAILAETFAVLVEAHFAKWLGVSNPWLWSILANASSLGIGLLFATGDIWR